jgi:N-dimethylarginine dimethylaminohydrolase
LASQALVRSSFGAKFEVSQEDALNFSCNALAIENTVFMPTNHDVGDYLAKQGYTVHEFDLSEFMRAGGAAKCLTLNC